MGLHIISRHRLVSTAGVVGMYTTMSMYTTIHPSVTITPVYKTAKEKCKVAVSSVTVQVEPVDLSTRPAQDSRHGQGLWSFVNTGPASHHGRRVWGRRRR